MNTPDSRSSHRQGSPAFDSAGFPEILEQFFRNPGAQVRTLF